jgi:hypothetical protein
MSTILVSTRTFPLSAVTVAKSGECHVVTPLCGLSLTSLVVVVVVVEEAEELLLLLLLLLLLSSRLRLALDDVDEESEAFSWLVPSTLVARGESFQLSLGAAALIAACEILRIAIGKGNRSSPGSLLELSLFDDDCLGISAFACEAGSLFRLSTMPRLALQIVLVVLVVVSS